MSGVNSAGAGQPAVGMSSAEVFPPEPPVVVLRGGWAVGVPSYDAVLAEHVPLLPGGESCRACGFVYTDRPLCPALILATPAVGADRRPSRVRLTTVAANVRPVALGYLRLHAADPPEVGAALTAQVRASADEEGLTLAGICTDLLDPPAGDPDRAGFCALMDAIRRHNTDAVIIPAADHLSRRPGSYLARRTIIEAEGGARLLVIHPGRDLMSVRLAR